MTPRIQGLPDKLSDHIGNYLDNLNVFVLGGGHGSQAIGRGLALNKIPHVIINGGADDGGYDGERRKAYVNPGVKPTQHFYEGELPAVGDSRRNMSGEMSEKYPLLSEVFEIRPNGGPARGIPVGSHVIDTAARFLGGDINKAQLILCFELGISPVLSASNTPVQLCGRWKKSQQTFASEREIDEAANMVMRDCIEEIWLSQDAELSPYVRHIMSRNRQRGKRPILVLPTGSLWASILSILKYSGLVDLIDQLDPFIISYGNMTTVPGETDGMSARDHLEATNQALGERKVDISIWNNALPPSEVQDRYERRGQELLSPKSEDFRGMESTKFIFDNLLEAHPQFPEDTIREEDLHLLMRTSSLKSAYHIQAIKDSLEREQRPF